MIAVHEGSCLEVMAQMIADGLQFDSVVCDPPYHLTSIVKRFGAENAAPAKSGKSGVYKRASKGFMGQQWDGGDIAFRPETWRLALALLKPGAHLVAFAATKNYHRMAVAIEDAGFDIRDMVAWTFGSGFPHSHNLDGEWDGFGSHLKPAFEPICVARRPLSETSIEANVLKWGTGAFNIDAARVGSGGGGDRGGEPSADKRHTLNGSTSFSMTPGPRGGSAKGRWPANLCHDGSDEVLACFPDAPGQLAAVGPQHGPKNGVNCYGDFGPRQQFEPRTDSGSAARFFYSSKATRHDRLATKHPTVKPIDLMRWLTRLVTPPGGRILDPFAGTGTTGGGAMLEGFDCDLIEFNPAYVVDIKRRLKFMRGEGRLAKLEKVDLTGDVARATAGGEDLPLFK